MTAFLKKYWLWIVPPLLYLIVVFPQLTNRISPNNHNLIITLTCIENWQKDGALAHDFNIIHSWGSEADKGVHYYPRVMSKEGRNYFVSYPPLSFILFYTVAQFAPLEFLPITFKLFGVVIHLLIYYVLVRVLLRNLSQSSAFVVSSLFVLFPSSVVLSVMYYPEQLILLIILLFYFHLDRYPSKWKVMFFGALLVYCDWLGLLVVGSIFLAHVVFKRQVLQNHFPSFIIGAIVGGAVLLVQYSIINDVPSLIQGLKIRYIERSGVFSEGYSDRGINLYNNDVFPYLVNHLLPNLIAASLLVGLLLKRKLTSNFLKPFWILVLPTGLHLVFIFNSNILHFQNLAKVSLLVIAVHLAYEVRKNLTVQQAVLVSIGVFSISFAVVRNYFDAYPVVDELYNKAEIINDLKESNSRIFIVQEEFSEDIVLLSYLTKRNLVFASSVQSITTSPYATIWIDFNAQTNGIIPAEQ